MLRFTEDWRSLLYMSAATSLFFLQWSLEKPHFILIFLSLAMAYGTGCILHNHAHLPIWRSRLLNALTDYWLILLRGDGVYSWIPTHIQNHHRYANNPGDETLTYRFGEKNNLPEVILYTTVSTYFYIRTVLRYAVRSFHNRPRYFFYLASQVLLHATFVGAAAWIDFSKCFWFILVPQAWGIFAKISTGYFQHNLTDEKSPIDFARNFTGPVLNFFHFNHGFHTVHHLDQGLHWTQWPEAHRRLAPSMHPSLNQKSLSWYFARVLVLSPFFHRFRIPKLPMPN